MAVCGLIWLPTYAGRLTLLCALIWLDLLCYQCYCAETLTIPLHCGCLTSSQGCLRKQLWHAACATEARFVLATPVHNPWGNFAIYV